MNIVLLCKSWNHRKVLDILEALREQGLVPRGIVAMTAPAHKITLADWIRKVRESGLPYLLSRFQRRWQHNGAAAVPKILPKPSPEIISSFQSLPENGQTAAALHSHQMTIAEYTRQYHIEFVMVKDLNGEECVAALRRLETDILLLGGTPIIRANVLAVPKIGTLNVHMGLLPRFRGMNVAEWSVFCGAPVGVTVHLVDAGVDTGAILYREEIEVSDCSTLEAMRKKLSTMQHRILAKCTRRLIENQIVPEPQPPGEGKQYYLMHAKLKKVVAKRLSQGYRWLNPYFKQSNFSNPSDRGQ